MVDRSKLITWSPSLLIVLLVLVSLGGPGSPEVVVLLALAVLQVVFLGVNAMLWGKGVVESAAGVEK